MFFFHFYHMMTWSKATYECLMGKDRKLVTAISAFSALLSSFSKATGKSIIFTTVHILHANGFSMENSKFYLVICLRYQIMFFFIVESTCG